MVGKRPCKSLGGKSSRQHVWAFLLHKEKTGSLLRGEPRRLRATGESSRQFARQGGHRQGYQAGERLLFVVRGSLHLFPGAIACKGKSPAWATPQGEKNTARLYIFVKKGDPFCSNRGKRRFRGRQQKKDHTCRRERSGGSQRIKKEGRFLPAEGRLYPRERLVTRTGTVRGVVTYQVSKREGKECVG